MTEKALISALHKFHNVRVEKVISYENPVIDGEVVRNRLVLQGYTVDGSTVEVVVAKNSVEDYSEIVSIAYN